MKTILTIIQISLINILIFNSLIASSDCPPELNCPSGVQYPYSICPLDMKNGGHAISICAEDPHNIPDLDWPYSPMKAILPICIELPDITSIPISFSIPPGNQVFSQIKAIEECNRAAFEWNCICGKQDDNCETGCKIKLYFSDNEADFDAGELAFTNLSYQKNTCSVNCENSKIFFNNTKSFRNYYTGTNKTFFINEDYINNTSIQSVYRNGGTVYSFFDVTLHEIGHILGFDHPDELAKIEKHFIKSYKLIIYPNPAGDFINISVDNDANLLTREVQILDLLGLVVSKKELTEGNNRIDISDLPRGTYFIKVGDKVEKFVKM